MTDSYKPLTKDDGLSCCGVQGCPCYDHDTVRSAVEGLRESVLGEIERHTPYRPILDTQEMINARKVAENILVEIDKWFPVFFVEQKEGED